MKITLKNFVWYGFTPLRNPVVQFEVLFVLVASGGFRSSNLKYNTIGDRKTNLK